MNGRLENVLFSCTLIAAPSFEIFEKPTSILLKKVNNNQVCDIKFFLEDGNGNIVDLNRDNLMFKMI